MLRSVTVIDGLFLASIGCLWIAAAGNRFGRGRLARQIGAVGWGLFSLFWLHTAAGYLITSRTFLGIIGLVTVGLAAYACTLVVRDRDAGARLTVAFSVMGALFVPFQFVGPIHGAVLGAVAAHTVAGLSVLGYDPIVGYGPEGYANVIYFEGLPVRYGIRIISACSGISAIALFVGLVAATKASPRKRLPFGVGVAALVYGLNLVRTMLVAGALGGNWFGFATGITASLYGVTDPRLASYYVAEYLLSQVLVVVALLGVYVALSARLSELQELVGDLLDEASTDWTRLVGQR